MKKFLSLVLALVMTMSLVTVSAGAKDFTDSSKIQYNEAIDVMSAIGVIDGYADGSFNPSTTLTRGAAAKIICNLLLGPTTANALVADAAPYKDVPVNHTFAGYIAYCQKEGIISGYADGTFRPAGTLTGYAFMKMLLGALGYDAMIEGYTGANWSINVAKRALNIGLADNLVNDFNGVKAVTREEACLYGFNMIQADMVEYDKKSTITVGDIVITDNSTAKSRTWNSQNTADGNIGGIYNASGVFVGDGIVQFAEEYFNKLEKIDGNVDAFSRPSTQWLYKGDEVGTYADKADYTYYKSVKLSDIYVDLKMNTKCANAVTEIYVNGDPATRGTDSWEVSKSNDAKLKDIDSKIGDGTIVEVFRDKNTNKVTIAAMSVYAGSISNVKSATAKKDAYVVVEPSTKYPAGFTSNNHDEFETAEFAEDDVVAYTYSDKDDAIKTMVKLEPTTGELTKRVVGKSVTLGDKTYKYAKECGYESGLNEANLKNKNEYNVYLDANGYALYIEEAAFSVTSYALVEKISDEKLFDGDNDSIVNDHAAELKASMIGYQSIGGSSTWDGNKAKLLFTDGTEKIVSLDDNYAADKGMRPGDIVRYKVVNGEYKLIAVKTANQKQSTSANFAINNKVVTGSNFTGINTDSKTVFVVNKSNDYTVYTGIKNAPTVASGVAYGYVNSDNVAQVVFVVAGTVTGSSKDVTFVAAPSVSKLVVENDGSDYYQYNAIVKGEITTIMVEKNATINNVSGVYVAAGSGLGTLAAGEGDLEDSFFYNDFTDDGDGVITMTRFDGSDVATHFAKGVKKMSADEIKLNTAGTASIQSVASNVKVYLVNTDGDISAITMADVKTDSTNWAYYTMEDGEITNLVIQETK